MAINPYFNFYSATNEQGLLESLIIESIRAYGFNTYYLPKTIENLSDVFRESTINAFTQAITIEAYLKSNMKFEGDGKFMSAQLGWEIRDQTVFTVSQSVFKTLTSKDRPNEGDLVYLPLNKNVYEIKFVEHQDVFYQLGKLMVWDLHCELLEYTGQTFNTGIAEIDAIQTQFDMDGVADSEYSDWNDQSPEFQTDGEDLINFSAEDPFANGGSL